MTNKETESSNESPNALNDLVQKLDHQTFQQLDLLLSSFSKQPKEIINLEKLNIINMVRTILKDDSSTDTLIKYLDTPFLITNELNSQKDSEQKNNLTALLLKYSIFFTGFLLDNKEEWRTVALYPILNLATKDKYFKVRISKMSNEVIEFESKLDRILPLLDYFISNVCKFIKLINSVDKDFLDETLKHSESIKENINEINLCLDKLKESNSI